MRKAEDMGKDPIVLKDAFDRYGYTLREIGDHLDLHPNYISSLLGKMRKT